MEIFTVGGAVRDEMLGLAVKDRDYVVVGATPQEMLGLGFRPVGKDFPVFLHPDTHEEYALARTERKTAPGYKGFLFHAEPTVTLEQDLARRDLTINAMARARDGRVIDPHGGQRDLAARILRHVGEAFAEDPVRILRLARFAARFDGFAVAPETRALCAEMVRAGEVDALVAERVWQEISRGLMEARPGHMLALLADCGALARLLPELLSCAGAGGPGFAALAAAARGAHALPLRWACLWVPPCAGGPDAALAASERLKAPAECRELALLAAREVAAIGALRAATGETLLALFERCDALRRPGRFAQLLGVTQCADPGASASIARCRTALAAARGVDAGAIAAAAPSARAIPSRVRSARLEAIDACLAD